MELVRQKATTKYAVFVLFTILFIALGANILLKAPIQPMFLIVWLFIYPACMRLGYSFKEIDDGVMESCKKGLGAVLILMAVGAIISTWIAAGTVPAIIYYGLKLISPKMFLLATFLLCSFVSIACGTSWGTMGTAGIAMFAIGESLGIPTGMTIGAIISGSYLGDMISPMSDSTNVAAAAAGTDLITHCKELLYLAFPVSVVTGIIYYILGLKFAVDNFDDSYIVHVSSLLTSNFKTGLIAFIPMIFLLLLLFFKKPAMLSMVASSLVAGLIAVLYQGMPLKNMIPVFWAGFKINSGEVFLDTLLNRGGVQSMFSSACMMLFAFGMIGALNVVGILDALVNPIVKKIKTVTQLTGISQLISIIGNTMGTNTFSLLMTGSLLAPVYKKFNLDPTNLSKAINSTSTVICPFIPWNASGIFVLGLFGGSVTDFIPYAFYSYLMPITAFMAVVFRLKVKYNKNTD
ncbi:Na+/H+ antiporter NhaC [Fusobacterium ulcerans]|uniref:Malate-2H(+)/Na(+)-lactate antiporter n=1 Tax=Fusobacterium ulcerans TaxID=861 RepID=A0AAX2J7N1_9FUSO|nr:Na+/H+ antiporter NhaC [Fusobacterium ulcerans]AVQ28062.1 Na+/H+ antiporter NhaC [Fusobacterium ulcerans]EFS25523.1 Na+/H+ antiporter NhaC [Fusobacterium ulcerans ATCC 49185]SQI99663.1 Malate-2H(+)/Na(+)-lactate antiporter [Fusobacterium ulcerans]